MVKVNEISDFTVAKAHCDSVIGEARELKALFSYESKSMVSLNKTRALGCIESAMNSLSELKALVAEMED